MTRVVILKSRLSYMGGLERYAKAIAQAFAKRGCRVTLLTTGELLDVEGVDVLSLGPHPSSTLLSLSFFEKAVQAWLIRYPQEIVFGLDRNKFQTHYRAGNGSHSFYLRQANSTILGHLKALLSPKDRFILQSEKALFENASLRQLFTNSKMVKEELLNEFQIEPNKIEVVYNGIDFNQFSFNESSKETALKQLQIPSCKTHLLFLGNNYKRKGLKFAFKALSELRHEDFQLSVVGKDKNIAQYQRLAEKYQIQNKVIFWGPQKNPLLFYQAADAFILPTLYDPFANVVVEALAMGLYVITSSYNGGHEVLTKESGYTLLNLKDKKEFIQALLPLFSAKNDFSYRMRIRKTIEHLEINKQLDKIVETTLKNIPHEVSSL